MTAALKGTPVPSSAVPHLLTASGLPDQYAPGLLPLATRFSSCSVVRRWRLFQKKTLCTTINITAMILSEQLAMVPYPDFWEMKEKAKKFQASLPPYSPEDAIREMKARGQYRTTGWIL